LNVGVELLDVEANEPLVAVRHRLKNAPTGFVPSAVMHGVLTRIDLDNVLHRLANKALARPVLNAKG
jgi:hypothetical protein